MAHYAFINEENVVVEVITGRDENDLADGIESWETYYASQRPGLICKRTSYNTYRDADGQPQHRLNGQPFRGQYAGIGDVWTGTEFITKPNKEEPTE